MLRFILCICAAMSALACTRTDIKTNEVPRVESFTLNLDQANRLAQLPLGCIGHPFPYKGGHTVINQYDNKLPQENHPAFYGCFDWHSAVHGHWSLIYLLKRYPDLNQRDSIISLVNENLSPNNLQREIDYFRRNKYTKNYERTYGWAWLLKLAIELDTWDNSLAGQWSRNVKPLADFIAEQYILYLPKLLYPIRVGTHSNTAFGLSFAYDYAIHFDHDTLRMAIEEKARNFYLDDTNCPINWEPGGYDFLSPCLEEINIMRRILPDKEFLTWMEAFIPGLISGSFSLVPAEVADRTDGALVHLDGLNFSRAWSLYSLEKVTKSGDLINLADVHFQYSLNKMFDGDYAGEHWLGSFALYALQVRNTGQ